MESDDKITSEIHPFLATTKERASLYNQQNTVAKLRFNLPFEIDTKDGISSPLLKIESDADGDLLVNRNKNSKNNEEKFIFIEFSNSTNLSLVAHQIWRGAFVLSDFILLSADEFFRNKNVLELGSGTGISSIIASIIASNVTITDLNNENIIGLINANLSHNSSLIKSKVSVVPLDFLDLNWSPQLFEIVLNAETIIAADVVYYDKITEGFVNTLRKILVTGRLKDIFIALEKRYVFTIAELDTVAPMYDYFISLLETILNFSSLSSLKPSQKSQENKSEDFKRESILMSGEFKLKLELLQISLQNYPIYFNYEPSKELVLWHLKSSNL